MLGIGQTTTGPSQNIPLPPMAPCPAGYAVGTFQDGISAALKSLPVSLITGPLNLITANASTSGSGNVIGPDGVTPCHQSQNTLPAMYYLGQALPGLASIGLVIFLLTKGAK
jgi:hypothetical protein